MQPEITFRRLTEDDLDLMHRWLNTPHVMRWYSPGGRTRDQVEQEYLPYIRGEKPTQAYVIMHGNTPIGYIQTYRVNDWPDYARHIGVDDDTAGVDLFIGEPSLISRGLGPAAIRAFMRQVVFGSFGARACVIGPEVANTAAIRAYEKAGFRFWKHALVPGEPTPEYLMRMTPEDLQEDGADETLARSGPAETSVDR